MKVEDDRFRGRENPCARNDRPHRCHPRKRKKQKKYQKTDAASLLNAPADNRDDALPLVYLAHRLDFRSSKFRFRRHQSPG